MMGDESMAEVVDFGVFDAGEFEVTINGSSDISDQKRPAGFGDKDGIIFHFWPDFYIVI